MSSEVEEIKVTIVKDYKYRIAMVVTFVIAVLLGGVAMSLPQMVVHTSAITTIDHDYRTNTTMVSHSSQTDSYAKDAAKANMLMIIGCIFVVLSIGFTVLALQEWDDRR